MAAAAGAAGVGDSTLTWAFERLIDCPALPVHVLTDTLLPVVAAVLADLPDCTRARLCLRLVDSDLQESRVDETTLEYLRELAACDVAPQADPALVRPSPELLLQVKTLAGLEALGLPPPDGEDLLNKVFSGGHAGVQITAEEWARYQELLGALGNPAAAAALRAQHPVQATAMRLADFVRTASDALPCLLLTVQADIAAGRYVPGAARQPVQAGAAPRRNYLSPGRVPPPQPPPQVQAAAAAAGADADLPPMDEGDGYESPAAQLPAEEQPVVQNLHARLDHLQQQGGEDPLPQMLRDAAQAQRQPGAAAAAAAAPRTGRTKTWDSPAMHGAAPQLPQVEPQHHSPLPQSARRQAGQAAVAMADSEGGGQAGRGEGARRKPKRWDPAEEAALVRLVKKHGRGNWALILKEGQQSGEIDKGRKQVDMKDKWRNLVKKSHIQPHEITEIEAREQELREEWQDQVVRGQRPPGRPPKFMSPGAGKRRRDSYLDGEEEGEEEQMEDAVENPDEDERAEAGEEAGEEGHDEQEEEHEEHEEGAEEAQGRHGRQRSRKQHKPRVAAGPERRYTRSQDAAQPAGRGGRGGRGKGRGHG